MCEHDENVIRKPFTISELAAIAEAIEERERPKAKERQVEHAGTAPGKPKDNADENTYGKITTSVPEPTAKAVAAAAVGMSRRTLEKAQAVIASGDEELIAEMDRTGKVDRAKGAFTLPTCQAP